MRVLVISAAFPPMRAGESDHAFYLSRHLAERGVEVHVLTTRGNEASNHFPFKVHPIMRKWSWMDLLRLAKFLKHCRPDGILLQYIGWIYDYHPMITFAPTLTKVLQPSTQFVTQFANAQGSEPERFSLFSRLTRKGIARWAGASNVDYSFGTLLRDSDRLIIYSDIHRAQLAERFSVVNNKSVLIPPPPIMLMSPEDHGAIRERGRKKLGVQTDEFLLAYFGYVYPQKGVETLLRAFSIVARKKRRARLLILGGFIAREFPGHRRYREEILALPKQLGIEHRVIWFGGYAWDSDEASVCLRAADAGVIPMDYGVQLNNSAFAAVVAHGLPVITTRGPVLEEPFVHEKNVLLCSPRDPEAMAEAIERLMESPELARRLKAGATEFAENWFSWEKAVARTVGTLSGDGALS
jgi:glycosyltransferase involved in cell wall biosynthesis